MPARFARAAIVALVLALLPPATPAAADTIRTPTPGPAISAYYDSAQWSKDISAVVKKAKANLKKDLANDRAAHGPALVLDIDETSVFKPPASSPSTGT